MRAIFGIVSVLLVLVIVGSLVKKQLSVQTAPLQNLPNSSPTPAAATPASANATVRDQSQQIQQRVKQAVEAQMQARPMPDDSK